MFEKDLLYGFNSVLIAVTLFVLIILANEAGYWFARRFLEKPDEAIKSQTNSVQAGMLGLLALLLGFSFTMGLQRFDGRSAAVIEESNSIGTAYLRVGLLSEPYATEVDSLIANYVDVRIEGGKIDMADLAVRQAVMDKTVELQGRLWRGAIDAANADPRPITSGYFIQSLNEVFDSCGRRQAALETHIPELVLFLLFTIFVISGYILGYAAGLHRRRAWVATMSMTALIVLVIFIVIDLDRPRRGLIQVDQSSMAGLKQQIEKGIAK